MPGEWYLDRASGTLYLYPPSDAKDPGVELSVEISVAAVPMVRMDDVSHVTLQGITWELGGADGVIIRGGGHCLLAGCTLRRLGGNGVEIHGGTAHGLRSCDLYSLGRAASTWREATGRR